MFQSLKCFLFTLKLSFKKIERCSTLNQIIKCVTKTLSDEPQIYQMNIYGIKFYFQKYLISHDFTSSVLSLFRLLKAGSWSHL